MLSTAINFLSQRSGARPILLYLLLFSVPDTHAEVTLAQAYEAAIQRHQIAALPEARRGIARAMQERADQFTAAAPVANLLHFNDRIGSDLGAREWEGGVTLPLWKPGQRNIQSLEAARTLDTAEGMSQALKLKVAGIVRERLWRVALSQAVLVQARIAHGTALELSRTIEQRVEAGELPRSDVLLARKEVLLREDQMRLSESELQQAVRQFGLYTGLTALPLITPEPLSQTIQLSEQHPLLLQANAGINQARAHINRVAVDRRAGPDLWVGGRTTRDQSGSDYNSSFGLELSIPFGSQGHSAPQQAEAEAALTTAILERDHLHHQLEEALSTAVLNHQQSQQALQRSDNRQQLADKSLRLSQLAFDLGEIDLLHLLQARRDAVDAKFAHQTRQLEVGLAIARLNQVLGVLPQ